MFDVHDALRQFLEGHGVTARIDGEWIATGEGFPKWRAWLPTGQALANGVSVQLDVNVETAKGDLIVESVGGVGATRDEAARDAFQNFCRNSLHVLLGAFHPSLSCADQIDAETWEIDARKWRVVIGPYGLRTFSGPAPAVPSQLWELIEGMAKALKPRTETVWLRTFFCNVDRSQRTPEALLNNEDWPEMRDALPALPWPASDTYYSVRHFMVMRLMPD